MFILGPFPGPSRPLQLPSCLLNLIPLLCNWDLLNSYYYLTGSRPFRRPPAQITRGWAELTVPLAGQQQDKTCSQCHKPKPNASFSAKQFKAEEKERKCTDCCNQKKPWTCVTCKKKQSFSQCMSHHEAQGSTQTLKQTSYRKCDTCWVVEANRQSESGHKRKLEETREPKRS